MKKLFTYLSCMLAVIIIIAHDSIHHHHILPERIEITDPIGHHEDDHHNDGDHFPPHQHILADADFFPVRNVFFGGKVLKQIQIESNQIDSFQGNIYNHHRAVFIRVSKDPPFLPVYSLSFNITRGSPALS